MSKAFFAIVFIAIIAVSIVFLFGLLLRGNEDDWIKNNIGIYEKHGVPSETPQEVIEQKSSVELAVELYEKKKSEGMIFNSQCLGVIGEGGERYAVDIVHVPRSEEDNKIENQCEAYRDGDVKSFIELDKAGNIVRIVD